MCAAIQSCLTAAAAQGKTVWFPAGTYYQSANFTLNGITVRGAGMWYTNLISTVAGSTFAGNIGFVLTGTGATVSDLHIESAVHTTRSTLGGKPFTLTNPCTNWTVQNVWITHTCTGFWMSGGVNGVIRGCRVRFTYADAININNTNSGPYAATNTLVELNHVRGSGDDGIAILSGTAATAMSTNNTIRFNTVAATWWGHNCDIAGGTGHVISDNYLADNAQFGCLTINLPGSFPMYPLTNTTISRNTIVRGGGNAYGQRRGAIWVFPGNQTISGVAFRDNVITGAIFRGIHLVGTSNQQLTFERNSVDHPGEIGILIESQAVGSGVFTSNTVRNLNSGFAAFTNSSANYAATLTGNSWQ